MYVELRAVKYYTKNYAYLTAELLKRLYYDCFGRTAFSDDFFSGTCNLVRDGYWNIQKYNCLRLKRNRSEFDWETNCLNRNLKYVTRWLLTQHWKIPKLDNWISLNTTCPQTSLCNNKVCILKINPALNRVTPSKAKTVHKYLRTLISLLQRTTAKLHS